MILQPQQQWLRVPVVSFHSLDFGGWCCGIHHPKVWEVLIFICIFLVTNTWISSHDSPAQSPVTQQEKGRFTCGRFSSPVILQTCPEVLVLCEEEEHGSLCLVFVCMCTDNFRIQNAQNRRNGGRVLVVVCDRFMSCHV